MSNLVASDHLVFILIVFMPLLSVIHAAKTSKANAIPTEQYSGRRQEPPSHARRDGTQGPNHNTRNQDNSVNPTQNDVIASAGANNIPSTLLKTKPGREMHRFEADSGHKVYKDRHQVVKPRKHNSAKNNVDNDTERKVEKHYYRKDPPKQERRPEVATPRPTQESIPEPKTSASSSRGPHHIGTSSKPDEDASVANTSSDQADIDNDLELSNGSMVNETTTASNSTGCRSCQVRESDKRYRIERLKQTILSSLHMKIPPNATRESIPRVPALTHLYESEEDMMSDMPYNRRAGSNMYDDDYVLKTERIFTKGKLPPSQKLLNFTDSLYFAPPIKLYTNKIKTAYLWFYIRKQEGRQMSVQLTIERILPESVPAKRLIAKTIFRQKIMRDRASGWKRIDIRSILRKWVAHPMSNHGLQIRALDSRGNNMVVLTPTAEVDDGYEPWLDTKVLEQKSHSRHRRSQSLRCTENANETRCCRYPLYITFAEIGWEWIIAPNQVKADYCSGECRMTMQDNTPHSWLHQQVPGTSGSCCSPTKLVAQPLMYFDDNETIMYQILKDIKVEECGCT